MDETANQMSDVRERLIETLDEMDWPLPNERVADAILAWCDVVEKPVVTDQELGRVLAEAHCGGVGYYAEQGASLREALEAKGLIIVRREEGAR